MVSIDEIVRVFLPDLGDEESAHAGAGPSPAGVGGLEAVEGVAALGFLPHRVQLGALDIVALGAVMAG